LESSRNCENVACELLRGSDVNVTNRETRKEMRDLKYISKKCRGNDGTNDPSERRVK